MLLKEIKYEGYLTYYLFWKEVNYNRWISDKISGKSLKILRHTVKKEKKMYLALKKFCKNMM